jgi:hypothetical protein
MMPPPKRFIGNSSSSIAHHHHPDPFRSRPQNTSRAPSTHVDDFLFAEATAAAKLPTSASLTDKVKLL